MKGHDQGASRWELSERVSFGSELPATPWRLLQQQSERRSQAHSSLRRELPDGNKCCVGTLGMNEGSAYLKRGWWLQEDYTEQRDLLEDTELAYLPPPSGRWGASLEISLETLLTSVKPAKDEVFKQECLYSDRQQGSLFTLFSGTFFIQHSRFTGQENRIFKMIWKINTSWLQASKTTSMGIILNLFLRLALLKLYRSWFMFLKTVEKSQELFMWTRIFTY